MEADGRSAKLDTRPPKRRGSILTLEALLTPESQQETFDALLARRDGSVLARTTILKSVHFGEYRTAGIEINLLGAPNFRQANLSVFGVAQPTIPGFTTILRLLLARPSLLDEQANGHQTCTWFSTREEPLIYINGRPFVLRDRETPFENIRSYSGISATRLEQMESRLKEDILVEAGQNNGILLVHDEVEEHKIVPCLTSIDDVQTSAELFASLKTSGFAVDYQRVPLSSEQSPTDAFIDEYVRIFQKMPARHHAVIFSCGVGIGRTTFAMAIGMMLRRALIIQASGIDPFHVDREVSLEDKTTKTVLRLVSVLEQGLQEAEDASSAVKWVLARAEIIDSLKAAIQGNYHVIVELVRALDHGNRYKRIVDEAIDRCEAVINIREQILVHRMKHFVNERSSALDAGIGYLERYFSLIAFCAYLDDHCHATAPLSFTEWIKAHRDIWNNLMAFRKSTHKLQFFRPIDSLASMSIPLLVEEQAARNSALSPIIRPQEEIPEYNVIRSRSGSVLDAHTILKIDHWGEAKITSLITGAPNLRRIPDTNIYATAQPTLTALQSIIGMIHEGLEPKQTICWINVREEPVVYIDNEPYVLRDRYATLRNIKSYSGITRDRLEDMEKRLKVDIISESGLYNHRLLVHYESAPGAIYPSWISLASDEGQEVMTMSEIFSALMQAFPSLEYFRLPVTAEEALEPGHCDLIANLVLEQAPHNGYVMFNCQMGAGRSTACAVVACLVLKWRKQLGEEKLGRQTPPSRSITPYSSLDRELHYRIIHSILRVVGTESKVVVDEAIDAASDVVNLREAIETCHRSAQSSSDPNTQRKAIRKGIVALKRYAILILFQGYLSTYRRGNFPDEAFLGSRIPLLPETFHQWLQRHQEFSPLLEELDRKNSLDDLAEEYLLLPEQGPALSSEVLEVIAHRRGQVLAAMTILKYDHFPGCQKTSLLERIEGAPNFREVILDEGTSVIGCAMPTKSGFSNVLNRIDRSLLWCCLREEPVLYINGRPFVLRIVKDPVVNLEMTGIVTERVESMEERLKLDLLRELRKFNGRILLHEEDASTGKLVPVWESVKAEDIETTAEILERLNQRASSEHSIVYRRIPITDEQAPIPEVFDHLLELLWRQTPDNSASHPIFNCQMGRGRTTTGMVITVLLYLVRNQPLVPATDVPLTTESLENLSISSDSDLSRTHYLAGEYKLIMNLLQVLEHGKRAKRLLDVAIDRCDAIQNLRTAIYDFKLKDSTERGLNYLLRYFFLITFSEYLLEIDHSATVPEVTFVEWLNERREITNMVSRREQVDFS